MAKGNTVTVPLVGSGLPAKAKTLNPSRLINFMPITGTPRYVSTHTTAADGSKALSALYSTPGTQIYSTPPDTSVIRGVTVLNDLMYFVAGSSVYQFDGSTYVLLGSILTSYGEVSIFTNSDQVAIIDGVTSYTYTVSTNTFAAIVDADFNQTALRGFFHKSRLVYVKPDSDLIYLSALSDFRTYAALDFASAEFDPQNTVTALPVGDKLYLFGKQKTEIWQVVADTTFPYIPIPDGIISYGIVAPRSVVQVNNGVMWLSQNEQGQGLLVTANGNQASVIIDEHASYQLANLTKLDDCVGQVFTIDGHTFYKLTFPTDNVSFLYDLQSKIMFQWASWFNAGNDVNDNANYQLGRHISDIIFMFRGKLICTDYRSGVFLEIRSDVYTDYECGVNNTIYREVTTPIVSNKKQRLFIDALELDAETGETGQAEETISEEVTEASDTYYLLYNGVRQYEVLKQSSTVYYRQSGPNAWEKFDFSLVDPMIYTQYTGVYPDTSIIAIGPSNFTGFSIETVEAGHSTVTYTINHEIEPIFNIAISKDGGRTFPYVRQISTGLQGQYETVAKLYKLGYVTDAAIKITTNHPGFIAINNLLITYRAE